VVMGWGRDLTRSAAAAGCGGCRVVYSAGASWIRAGAEAVDGAAAVGR
jgi:hypothetical protein